LFSLAFTEVSGCLLISRPEVHGGFWRVHADRLACTVAKFLFHQCTYSGDIT
jgi:hypothetical protein